MTILAILDEHRVSNGALRTYFHSHRTRRDPQLLSDVTSDLLQAGWNMSGGYFDDYGNVTPKGWYHPTGDGPFSLDKAVEIELFRRAQT